MTSASALRRYLMDQRALPKAPLVGVVPVSVREDDFSDSGNDIAFAMVNASGRQALKVVSRSTTPRTLVDVNGRAYYEHTRAHEQIWSLPPDPDSGGPAALRKIRDFRSGCGCTATARSRSTAVKSKSAKVS